MSALGTVEQWTDSLGRPSLRRLDGTTECPECGKEVQLWAETVEWTEDGKPSDYGPPEGICCGLLLMDDGEFLQCFVLPVFDERSCRKCGCTDDCACPGGCWWVGEDLCSACAGEALDLA
ncbi:MAG: hypothetical protein GC160_02820 [Acidobacteria bacterium]|nr:hypothetical protein [Acidobacteriota bacterium]